MSSEELLSKRRGTRRVYLRHISNSSDEVNKIVDTFTTGDFNSIVKLSTLKNSLSTKIEKVKKLDQEIIDLLDDKEAENVLDEIILRDDEHLEILSKINILLSKPASQTDQLPLFNNSTASFQEKIKVHLPKLEIEKLEKFLGSIFVSNRHK